MTISETTSQNRNDYQGNNASTVFAFTFIVLEESNQSANRDFTIKVLLTESGIETEKVENTDYTVQLNEDGLGTITFVTAPTATQQITFLSAIPITQSTDYINIGTGKFPADSHEGTVDKLTLINREQGEKINRSILLPESSILTSVNIPVSVDNADKAIVVNSAGDNLDAKNLADIGVAPVTDFAKTLLDDVSAVEARTTLNAQEDVITTRGDVIRGDSSGDAGRLAIGAANKVLTSDGADVSWEDVTVSPATTTTTGVSYLPKNITISNGTDADQDIDISSGNFKYDDGSGQGILGTALTKQLDATWSAGSAAGGLDTGSVAANNTTYYIYGITKDSDGSGDVLHSASPTAPTMPSGYTKFGRIGQIVTDGSANISPKLLGIRTSYGQKITYQTTDVVAISGAVIPQTDNKPQSSQGGEVMALETAFMKIGSRYEIDIVCQAGSNSASGSIQAVALFQDAGVNAIASTGTQNSSWPVSYAIPLSYENTVTALTATTFKVRTGASNSTTSTFNGILNVRMYGGVCTSKITIKEYF